MSKKQYNKMTRVEKVYICCMRAGDILYGGEDSFTHCDIKCLMSKIFKHASTDNYYKELNTLCERELVHHDEDEHLFMLGQL